MDGPALEKWSRDDHRFAPYQYAKDKLGQNIQTKQVQPPTTRTQETLMEFSAGHIGLGRANTMRELEEGLMAHDEGRPTETRRLARMCASYSSHKGNEVKPEAGPRRTLDRPTWQQIDARERTWKTVISCTWQGKGESMPALGTRAINLALLRQTMSVVRLNRIYM